MKERIAIFLDTEKKSGGAYQELVYMIEKIDNLNKNKVDKSFNLKKKIINLFKNEKN